MKRISLREAGLDADAIDPSVNVCKDLYQYACGNWVRHFQIPPDKVTYERTFSKVADDNDERLHGILEGLPERSPDPATQALHDFYRACMDETTIDRRGLEPLLPYLDPIEHASTREDLAVAVATIHPIIDAFFSFGTDSLPTDSNLLIAYIGDGGIKGLVSTDSYLGQSPETVQLRQAYLEHAVRMLMLAHVPAKKARVMATDAIHLQTELARAIAADARLPDSEKRTTLDLAGLERQAPGFPWAKFFAANGLTKTDAILVTDVGFIKRMAELFSSTKLEELEHYAYWRALGDMAYVLGTPFADERSTMSQAMWGKRAPEPRWKLCVGATAASLRDPLTQAFLTQYLPASARDEVRSMAREIQGAFDTRLQEVAWLDEATRKNARDKLALMEVRIGAPEHLAAPPHDVAVDRYAENVVVPFLQRAKARFGRVGTGIDRAAWRRSPLETNAWVDVNLNATVFPAAFLEPPVFNPAADVPVRFGAIGFHIGHEMTHGFDDSGSKYDGRGNLANWWSPDAWRRFEERTSCIESQFAAYPPIVGLYVDAKRTLGENVADLGGLKLAFRAYRNARKGADEVLVADGFSEDQQFFLSFAQDHCVAFGDEDLKRFLQGNVHAPHWLRVDGVVQNLPEFSRAFGCELPAEKCEVW